MCLFLHISILHVFILSYSHAVVHRILSFLYFMFHNPVPLFPFPHVQNDKPLEEAVKFLIPLQALAPRHTETHTMAYEIHSRRRKFLLMLQALKRLHSVDPENGELHRILVDFMLMGQYRMY